MGLNGFDLAQGQDYSGHRGPEQKQLVGVEAEWGEGGDSERQG
jgi:hypothetical protein